MNRKLIVYIAMTVDGYIAGKDHSLAFLDEANQSGEDYGYETFIQSIDTIIVGRNTYNKVLTMGVPYVRPNIQTFVITSKPFEDTDGVIFYTQNVIELVEKLKAGNGKNIFCDGGAQLINTLLEHQLVDELIMFKMPVLLGDGIRLFQSIPTQQKLKLKHAEFFNSGVIQEHYLFERQ
jgi:dihydrofolate reductase